MFSKSNIKPRQIRSEINYFDIHFLAQSCYKAYRIFYLRMKFVIFVLEITVLGKNLNSSRAISPFFISLKTITPSPTAKNISIRTFKASYDCRTATVS